MLLLIFAPTQLGAMDGMLRQEEMLRRDAEQALHFSQAEIRRLGERSFWERHHEGHEARFRGGKNVEKAREQNLVQDLEKTRASQYREHCECLASMMHRAKHQVEGLWHYAEEAMMVSAAFAEGLMESEREREREREAAETAGTEEKRAWERQREKIVHKLTELGGRERESQREKAEMNEAFSKLLLDRDLEVLFVHACLQAPYSDPNTYLT
jgi:hypothetical protein